MAKSPAALRPHRRLLHEAAAERRRAVCLFCKKNAVMTFFKNGLITNPQPSGVVDVVMLHCFDVLAVLILNIDG